MNKLANYTMERIQEILNTEILGNTVLAYIISLGIFIVLLLVVIIFHKIFVKRLKKIAAKTHKKKFSSPPLFWCILSGST